MRGSRLHFEWLPDRVAARPGLFEAFLLLVLALVVCPTAAARAELPHEEPGEVERLALPPHAHWVWVSDLVLRRTALIDLDGGRFLGMLNGGFGTVMPLFPSRRPEIYLPATYYSRGTRGKRTDVLTIYDLATLSPIGEVILPPRRATNAVALGHSALSDDDRFVAVFNWTTGTSLSVVDVVRRLLTTEINTPGCSLVYAAGPRRFFSICGDGSLFVVTLNDDGREASRRRTEPFFDPRADPVTEKAVRWGDQWIFVSFEGVVHPVDVSGPEIRFGEPWSLVGAADREDSWRIGGLQHLAVHQRSGRLYALMHRGGPDTHKQTGEEVWIYDLISDKRVERVKLRNPGLTIYGFPVEFGGGWPRPFNHLSDWLIDVFAPAAVGQIQVTQGDRPLLFTAAQFSGSLGVYDAMTGLFLDRVQPTGWTSDVLLAPWTGKAPE
jgi:methylamine dehydrogenase heavy chain